MMGSPFTLHQIKINQNKAIRLWPSIITGRARLQSAVRRQVGARAPQMAAEAASSKFARLPLLLLLVRFASISTGRKVAI